MNKIRFSPPSTLPGVRRAARWLSAACLPLLLCLAPSMPLTADDAVSFHEVSLGDLELLPGDGGEPASLDGMVSPDLSMLGGVGSLPWLRFDDRVEAYLGFPGADARRGIAWARMEDLRLVVRLTGSEPVTGFIDLPDGGAQSAVGPFSITLDPAALEVIDEEPWLAARRGHHQRLADAGWPGAAWFRHLARVADAGEEASAEPAAGQALVPPPPPMGRDRGMDGTFAFFSGGRAVAENLALDQALFRDGTDPGGMEVHAFDDITGVTVREFDWTTILADEPTALDPLAGVVPFDQHVLFFGSTDSLQEALTVIDGELLPWMELTTLVNRRGDLLQRYRDQIGIGNGLLEQIAPLVQSIAITGGDPWFDVGTDVAVIMESEQPDRLFDQLADAIGGAVAERVGVEQLALGGAAADGAEGDPRWLAFQSPDRSTSAILLAWGDHVAVGNSVAGLERLRRVTSGDLPSLASLDEFRFFRQRYRLDEEESAMLFLSDATIRRWTGPEQRIGASRRSRALAALRDLTAGKLASTDATDIYGSYLGGLIPPAAEQPGAGAVANGGWISTRWGGAGFLYPLAELDLAPATDAERAAYEVWRDRYERNWSVVFDPIALRLTLTEDTRGFDLSVIPLIDATDYRWLMMLTGDAKLDQLSRTRADDGLLLLSLAVDPDGEMIQQFAGETLAVLPGLRANPLGWVGGSLSLFLEGGSFWDALAGSDDPDAFFETIDGEIPIGLRISVRNRLGLGLFMTAIKGFSEAAAPGLLSWQQREYDDQPYVSITGRDNAGLNELGFELQIHYAAMDSALLVTLSEEVLQRAIDRERAARAPAGDDPDRDQESIAADASWPDEHVYFEVDPVVLQVLAQLDADPWTVRRRVLSWQALPILNEWHRRDPDADAAVFHGRWFGEPLVCPGGLGYRWNAEDHTFESVAYGHPGAPREEPAADIVAPTDYRSIGAGLHFDHGGLRARGFLRRAGAAWEGSGSGQP